MNVNLVRKKRQALLSVAVFANSSVVLLAGYVLVIPVTMKMRALKEELEICLYCWNVLQDCCCVSIFKLIVSNG